MDLDISIVDFWGKLVSKTFRVVRALHVSGIGAHSIVLNRGESMSGYLLKEENKYINRAPSLEPKTKKY